MESAKIVDMLLEALRAMGIGISGVFLVLAVFYGTIKLIMAADKGEKTPE